MSDEEDKMNKEEIIEDEGENSASFRTQRYFISQLEENLKKNFQFFFSIGSFIDSSRALPKSTIDNEQIELFLAAGQLECSIKLIYETTFDVPLKPSSNICNEILCLRATHVQMVLIIGYLIHTAQSILFGALCGFYAKQHSIFTFQSIFE
ncbi:MAG: hypothetical protein MHMPM18_004188 [Marteilia pararefringens]